MQRRTFDPISDRDKTMVSCRGYSLVELTTVLLIVIVLGFIGLLVFPFFAKSRGSRINPCLTKQKYLGLAFLQYIQDNDERFPPAVTYYQAPDGVVYPQDWALPYTPATHPEITVPSTLGAYLAKQAKRDILYCSEVKNAQNATFMFNDLAAGQKQESFNAVAITILIAEGEDQRANVGHAYLPDVAPQSATRYDKSGTCASGKGATVQTAPLRHSDGATYCFSDGHVKWTKPNQVFFPDVNSTSRSHKDANGKAIGPIPGVDMRWKGKEYRGTFHLR